MADKVLKSLQFEADGDKYLIPEEVFIATYGTTTLAEILAANTEGKQIIVKEGQYRYIPQLISTANCLFTYSYYQPSDDLDVIRIKTADLTSEGWTKYSSAVQRRLVDVPSVSDAGKILMVNSSGGAEWTAITNAEEVAY